jgi:alpha-glucosidase/alpha-D-xyloside xylohydrolase
VLAKAAKERRVYLPRGRWFDWWTGVAYEGGREVVRAADLATLPLFVRAGSIIPLDPVRQHTAEAVTDPTELRVFPGADGEFTLYDDDGRTLDYLTNDGSRLRMAWDDAAKVFTIEPANAAARAVRRSFTLRVMSGERTIAVEYRGERLTLSAK